ncbi:MAG: PAS-domain containing protein, partial [Proteobacteria bacterium]|nr:PAS-domain containing protein [Pseudomonadota bacterium]
RADKERLELEIAERKRVERALTQTEARWRGAVEGLQEAFALYGPDDKLIYWNAEWARLHVNAAAIIRVGMPYEDLVRAHMDGGFIPEAVGREEDFLKERLALRENPKGEILREYADGTWFLIKESRTKDGGYVATNTDITQLKQTEARLIANEERLRQIVDALQEGFALYNSEDRLVMWNEKWREIHRDVADIISVGLTFEDLNKVMIARNSVPEAEGREQDFIKNRIARHQNPGEPIMRELRDGHWYIIREVPTPDGGIFSIQVDITDVKQAEEKAEKLRIQAELENRAKSSLLVNMSHELRTPLNAIIGFSQILEQGLFGPLGNDRYQGYAKDVHDAGQHLLSLINDLLDISKIELSGADLKETNLDIRDCINECITMLEQRAIKSDISVVFEMDPELTTLYADERRIKQIILNVAGNAVKFSPPTGLVRIKAQLLKNGACRISVVDHGSGISAKNILRVTEPFYQTDDSYARQTDGIGLGLYIANSLCKLHGAELAFDSELGSGTTVSITFSQERTVIPADLQHAAE